MRDKGRPLPPRDSDVLADTLKSLQDLIQEVGAPAVPAAATPTPVTPANAAPRPARTAPAPARNERAARHAPVEFESAPDESPPAVTYTEDSPIEWYDHPTGPDRAAPGDRPHDLGWNDIPMLDEVVLVPGADQPRARSATAGTAVSPDVLPAVVDRILDRLDDELRATTGLALDVGTRSDLLETILGTLQRWATVTRGSHRARTSSALSGQDDENPL